MFKSAVELPGPDFWAKAFRCTFCQEVLTLKIFYCEKGHFVCHKCTKCGCGAKLTKVQATFLENVVRRTKFMCGFECGTKLTNDEYVHHVEEACRRRPVQCPLCSQVADFKEYVHHLKRLHNIQRIDLDDGFCSIEITDATQAIQYTVYQDQIYLIRWSKNKLWVQSLDRCPGIVVNAVGGDYNHSLKPARLHAEFYEADSFTPKVDESVALTFSYSRNGDSTFRFSGVDTEN